MYERISLQRQNAIASMIVPKSRRRETHLKKTMAIYLKKDCRQNYLKTKCGFIVTKNNTIISDVCLKQLDFLYEIHRSRFSYLVYTKYDLFICL